MDTRVQKHTAKYDAASKDLQAVHGDMVLNYWSRWDGKLPQYTLGGNVVPFIQIPGTAAGSLGESGRR